VATSDFSLDKGPLPVDVAPHPLEPTLRKLGLPTRLNASVVELLQDTTVCKAGDVLTPEQCRLLQLFDQKQAAFRIHLIASLTYTAERSHATLEVMREDAITQPSDSDATPPASAARPKPAQSKTAAAARGGRGARMQIEQKEEQVEVLAADEDEAEEEQDEEGEDGSEDEEFVPEPLQGWGEVAVPTYT